MRYFKVVMSAGDAITVSGDELEAVLRGIAKRAPAVICENGVFNSAFYVEIVVDKKKEQEVVEARRVGMKEEKDSAFATAIEQFRNNNKLLE